jgi:hypothetical protein
MGVPIKLNRIYFTAFKELGYEVKKINMVETNKKCDW